MQSLLYFCWIWRDDNSLFRPEVVTLHPVNQTGSRLQHSDWQFSLLSNTFPYILLSCRCCIVFWLSVQSEDFENTFLTFSWSGRRTAIILQLWELAFRGENAGKAEYKIRTNLDLKKDCRIAIYFTFSIKRSTSSGSRKDYLCWIFLW